MSKVKHCEIKYAIVNFIRSMVYFILLSLVLYWAGVYLLPPLISDILKIYVSEYKWFYISIIGLANAALSIQYLYDSAKEYNDMGDLDEYNLSATGFILTIPGINLFIVAAIVIYYSMTLLYVVYNVFTVIDNLVFGNHGNRRC